MNKVFTPYCRLIEDESMHAFLSFCTFIYLIHGKKLNLANIFLLCLKNENIKKLLRITLDIENDYKAFKMFFEFDPTLHKSKYIMKYLNNRNQHNEC
jgi:hypothetical protein